VALQKIKNSRKTSATMIENGQYSRTRAKENMF